MKPIKYIMCLCVINEFVSIRPMQVEEDLVSGHEGWNQLPDTCGLNKPARRIVGGRRAYLGQFPWMARLGYSREASNVTTFECGAGLISKWHVLTAAHCVLPEIVTVRVGEYNEVTALDCEDDRSGCAPPVQDIEPWYILNHPLYNASTAFNDISLIWLSKEVQFNDFVQPLCLPRGSIIYKDFTLSTATVAGWGRVHRFKKINKYDDLHYVRVKIRDKCACNTYYPFRKIAEGQICAGQANGDDSCTGDSGGPLFKIINENWGFKTFMIGLVSYGLAQCGEGPSVYTDVSYHMKWILDSLVNLEKTENYEDSTTIKSEIVATPVRVLGEDIRRPASNREGRGRVKGGRRDQGRTKKRNRREE